ncbi:MAG: flagellar biosynthetic protein FliR [Chromatiaceae bacterium]
MTIQLDQLSAWVLAFLWPFVRIAAMLSAMPLIGGRLLPVRVRLVLALALTWVLLPVVGPVPRLDPLSPAAVLVVVNQVLIGAAMGLALQVMFNALVVGGQIIGASMGLGFASVVDPQNGIQVPVVSQLYFLLGALIFLALDGHLTVVELVARSFVSLPVDGPGLDPQQFRALALWGALLFSEGMRLALPVVSVVLLANLALGVATRAAPQLNVFALGFSITLMLGLMAMLLSLGNLGTLFTGMLARTFSMIAALVAA